MSVLSRMICRDETGHRSLAASLAAILLAGLALAAAPIAAAADLSGFDPGYIITDQNFTDSGSMDAAAVQSFLTARGSACRTAPDGTPCLKDFRTDTPTKVADDRCRSVYVGRANQSAAEIVVGVAQACAINPRVLLVMLQKEQSLITRATATASNYQKAMGYRCPDTAPCDALYFGLFNQVFSAAWQLNNYALTPTRWNHRAGIVNNVRYHPNADCGSAPVLIRNQATASLYNYTPYQPNPVALAAGYGLGDLCSSYGNRNFWNYYTDWFGAPNGSRPIGSVDSLSSNNTTITVRGWTLDPDSSASVEAHIYIDSVGGSTLAGDSRPDVASFGLGDRHGFTYTAQATPGPHTVCTFAIASDQGPPTLLNCGVVVVPDSVPIGAVDVVDTTSTSLTVTGWTLDPDTTASNQVHVYVDGVGTSLIADLPRADVSAAYGRGELHGFSYTAQAEPGRHDVCVYGINTVNGANTALLCRTVEVDGATAPPIGAVDALTTAPGSVSVSGWALDPDTAAPTEVHIYIDGSGASLLADGSRPDVGAVYGRGDLHGFQYTATLAPGPHRICTFAINSAKGDNTPLDCRNFVAPNSTPLGAVDSVSATSSSITLSGWTLDPDTNAPNEIHVYVDGVGVSQLADRPRADLLLVYGRGDRHGFTVTIPATPGTKQLCVYGIDTSSGPSTAITCQGVVVPAP